MATRAIGVRVPGRFAAFSLASATQRMLAVVIALTFARVALTAHLPLSFDEAYFWLWSKNLAVAYYDHPPMIALAIRLGTRLFGDTEFGVRFVPLAASIAASWAVWRAGAIILRSEPAGAAACLLFNATLMVAAESMAATPDALVLAAAAFLLYAIAKLEQSNDGRWWIVAGLSVAIALLTKYTALFLGMSLAAWLVITPQGRVWLRTPWPYTAAALAIMALVPTLWWNASHDWISFRFQFGRVVTGGLAPGYLLEFAGSQLVLASPFLLVLAGFGLARASTATALLRPTAFSAALVWPALVYFTIHALHDRVQGNWPSFVYPGLAVLAASAFASADNARWLPLSRKLVLPTALVLLVGSYAQAFFGLIPLGGRDPLARMTAVGIAPVADAISHLAEQHHAQAIVTSKYVVTGWLRFYLEPPIPVIQINQEERWLSAPRASRALLEQPLLYVTQHPGRDMADVMARFRSVTPLATLARKRDGKRIDEFYVFALNGFTGDMTGRMP